MVLNLFGQGPLIDFLSPSRAKQNNETTYLMSGKYLSTSVRRMICSVKQVAQYNIRMAKTGSDEV